MGLVIRLTLSKALVFDSVWIITAALSFASPPAGMVRIVGLAPARLSVVLRDVDTRVICGSRCDVTISTHHHDVIKKGRVTNLRCGSEQELQRRGNC